MSDSKEARKLAIAAYKNRKPTRGVFAVRCAASRRVWVGASPDLNAARNGLWFMLRSGSAREAEMLADWRTYGEDTFSYEVLEELEEDVSALRVRDILRQKKQEWAVRERAPTLLP